MGLTIHYELRVEKRLARAVVHELVQRTALYARKIGCAETGEVRCVDANTPGNFWYVTLERQGERYVRALPPLRGWLVEIWPGEGCESAAFGLCQYQQKTPCVTYDAWTGAGCGWVFRGHCKTQYAHEHGWEHFLRCHKTIISILDFWRRLGVKVEVSDEGGYWETRSEQKLRGMVERYDGLIAAVAGAFKDAADESASRPAVESPIFARKDFERLEAEGRREFGKDMNAIRGLMPG
ncbi:MAG: hypothetical protein HZA89_01185 [Verrucomicrobia bacterium]|nr:hypothetical protein [Verrucomicrobiota bacterium]